jgi:mannose/fructose-specific phosphotransferase system component IIA
MNQALHGVVVAHGDVAVALIGAVEEISGIRGALAPVSNRGCDRDQLEQRIIDAVAARPTVVFVDMPSGSCLFAAMRRLKGQPDVAVVTGVNLAMLLDFLFHRDQTATEAAARAVDTGLKAMGVR